MVEKHAKADFNAKADFVADVRKYVETVDEKAVAAIVKYCGIALRKTDSAMVSGSDKEELARIRVGFARRKLGLDAIGADAGINAVLIKMKGDRRKSRVAFYYLLAMATGNLSKLS